MKIQYNSPFILTYTFLCVTVMTLSNLTDGVVTSTFFTVYPQMEFSNPFTYFRLFSHVIGHGDWSHLVGNFSFILLIGPILEEKYGTKHLLFMAFVTAIVTGLLNNLFFNTGLLGASGIVFMLILLSSFANVRAGNIPLTFILVVFLFIGREVYNAFTLDNISQFAHIMGGICGSFFGFHLTNQNNNKTPPTPASGTGTLYEDIQS